MSTVYQVSFSVTTAEALMIGKIVKRGMAMAKEAGRKDIKAQDVAMDITAVHANGTPLRLQRFLDADDFNFAHDFFGINQHIDRETGGLMHFFLPRCSA